MAVDNPGPEAPPAEPAAEPKTRRRRREGSESSPAAGAEAVAPSARPAYAPTALRLNSIAKRIVRTGQYESFEVSTMLEVEPDPNYSTRENLAFIGGAVTAEVNRLADQISQQFNTGDTK